METTVDKSFTCSHCGKDVSVVGNIGTKNRNHCPHCLWSKHVDELNPGDRLSKCGGDMRPVGITFKKTPADKWGKIRVGELMLTHVCEKCNKVNHNRTASDDNPSGIQEIAKNASVSNEVIKEVEKQLFGK